MRYGHFGTKKSDNKKAPWIFHTHESVHCEHECALSFSVVTSLLDLDALATQDRVKFLSSVDLTTKKRSQVEGLAEEEQRLMATLPRMTLAGPYDVDGDDREAIEKIARMLLEEEERRGNHMRVSRSSGEEFSGLHLEFGPVEDGLREIDLLRVFSRRAGSVAASAGLVPQKDSNFSSEGVPLFWVLPSEQNLGKEAGARLDLSPLNKSAEGRGSMFRIFNGENKHGTARKCLANNVDGKVVNCAATTRITQKMVDEAPAPKVVVKAQSGSRKRKSTYVRERRPARTGLWPLVAFWKKYYRGGDCHDARLAFAAMLQRANILDREDFVGALGEAWKDRDDAAAAWDSTRVRVRQGLPCKGGHWLRQRFGGVAMWEFGFALSIVCDRPIASIAADLGRPLGNTDLVNAMMEDEELEDRGKRTSLCLKVLENLHCGECATVRFGGKKRCDNREVCWNCGLTFLEGVERGLRDLWKGVDKVALFWVSSLSTREEALEYISETQIKCNNSERLKRCVYPERNRKTNEIRWHVLAWGKPQSVGSAGLGVKPLVKRKSVMKPKDAIREIIFAMGKRYNLGEDLFRSGAKEEALQFLKDVKEKHSVVGNANALPWPTSEWIAEKKKEWREKVLAEEEHGCLDLPLDKKKPDTYTATHIPSQRVLIEKSRNPISMAACAHGYYSRGADPGLQDPVARVETPLRL